MGLVVGSPESVGGCCSGLLDARLQGLSCAASLFPGFVIDPVKCSHLSLDEKRELVYEISLCADNAPEILQSWSRRELLQIICAEMGKERKYTGLTKPRMIARLLKLMSARNGNRSKGNLPDDIQIPPLDNNTCSKKKKKEHALQLLPASGSDNIRNNSAEKANEVLLCKNIACRAGLSSGEAFCQRCSCCICHCYDDNKDPSLWLVCNSDPPYISESCGMSCHLVCVLNHEMSGVTRNGSQAKLDGSYFCIACGKVNDLMRSWRKQLLIANEARRVDLLCQRISLSHNILKDSEQYKGLHSFVNLASKKLMEEVGDLGKVSVKMACGAVEWLSCAKEVKKLCSLAIEAADSLLHAPALAFNGMNSKSLPICHIQFRIISSVAAIIYLDFTDPVSGEQIKCAKVWHRVSGPILYPEEPTCIIHCPEKHSVISGLTPSTEYWFKVSLHSSTKECGTFETCWVMQTPGGNDFMFDPTTLHAREDEAQEGPVHPILVQSDSQRGSTNSSDNSQSPRPQRTNWKINSKAPQFENTNNHDEGHLSDDVPFVGSNSDPLETPSKSAGMASAPDATNKEESVESEYEYCVKVIRWLECEGYMEKDFRVKFLTWFSLKATKQERRVVKAFIDVLIDEPDSLVDQLIDAFVDGICSKDKPLVPNTPWH